MGEANILLIESARISAPSFKAALVKRDGYVVRLVASGKQALKLLPEFAPHVIVLDAASLKTSGERMLVSLRKAADKTPIIHVQTEDAAQIKESTADVTLRHPFTARKLINRIERFLNANKGEHLQAGDLSLNVEHCILLAHGEEKRLTPKLTRLIELFMKNPHQVLARAILMKEIWETDYMGDTRTLDVHIRWARQAVEVNPSKPEYIRTVRGVGYRFEPLLNGNTPSASNGHHA